MQITYELTQKDFIEAYIAHRDRKAWAKWAIRIFIWLGGLFMAVALVGLLLNPGWEEAKFLLPFFIVVFIWMCLLWWAPNWWMKRQFQQQPGAHGPRTLTLDDNGTHWKWSGGSSDVEWKNYILSTEGKNQILFYTSPAMFNIVPKRAMTPEQLEALRALLDRHIHKNNCETKVSHRTLSL